MIAGDSTGFDSLTQVLAFSGGDVDLPLLTAVSGGPVILEADGASSQLNVSDLNSITGNSGQAYSSTLQATHDGTLTDSSLGTFSNVNLVTDSTVTLNVPASQTFTFADGTNTAQAAELLDQGTLSVQGNAVLDVDGTHDAERPGSRFSTSPEFNT